MLAGNVLLTDAGFVLYVQIDAAGSTYMAENPRQCMEASLRWTLRTDSHVEYTRSQVWDNLLSGCNADD
jgi:hypothetical protein